MHDKAVVATSGEAFSKHAPVGQNGYALDREQPGSQTETVCDAVFS